MLTPGDANALARKKLLEHAAKLKRDLPAIKVVEFCDHVLDYLSRSPSSSKVDDSEVQSLRKRVTELSSQLESLRTELKPLSSSPRSIYMREYMRQRRRGDRGKG